MAWDIADIQNAVDAHAFNGYQYFGGTRPAITQEFMNSLDLRTATLAGGTESWADFLFVNDIHY